MRDCNTNNGGYGAGPVLRGFEEVAAALRGFGLGDGVQADAEFQQVYGKDLGSALLAWNVHLFRLRKRRVGMSTHFLKNRWSPCLSWVSGLPWIRTFGSQSINFSLG